MCEYKQNLIDSIVNTDPFETVRIGTQTWMKYNLDIGEAGRYGNYDKIYVIENVSANGVNFGTQHFYTYDAAVRIADTIEGWHLPSKDEYNTLITYCGGSTVAGGILKSTTGWTNNGTDDYGFNGLPVGRINQNTEGHFDAGNYANFWTTDHEGSNDGYEMYLASDSRTRFSDEHRTNGFSVRLIKDA